MGIRIHLFVETWNKDNLHWESVDKWNTEDKDDLYVEYENRFYQGEYYSVYALLAGVNNYYNIEPISQPRGLPINVSKEVRTASRQWEGAAHTRSYFTLKELLDYDWNTPIQEGAYMFNDQWTRFYESIKTDSPNYDLRFPCAQGIGESMRNSFTWHKWEIPAKAAADDFYEKVIPRLKDLGKPEDVRIVFFF